MRVLFKGQYLGDYTGVPRVGEARVIKRELNMLPADFEVALDGMDPDATSLLVALMQDRKAGQPAGTSDHNELDFEYHDVEIEYTKAELADMTVEQRKMIKEVKKNGDKLRALTAGDKGKDSGSRTGASE